VLRNSSDIILPNQCGDAGQSCQDPGNCMNLIHGSSDAKLSESLFTIKIDYLFLQYCSQKRMPFCDFLQFDGIHLIVP
jgi:hypothetical protein